VSRWKPGKEGLLKASRFLARGGVPRTLYARTSENLPSEAVRKGVRATLWTCREAKLDRKVAFRCSLRLHSRLLRPFWDSFSTHLGE
jgi:hypothetical protein